MKKLKFLRKVIIGLSITILPNVACDAIENTSVKPNILFIYADDWGWGDLSCHGHPHVKTPNIDKLASEGIDFNRFTVGNPVCSPSRATIMTGNFPARHKIHSAISTHEKNVKAGIPDWLDPNVTLLPRLLKEAGYATGHFGKWHLSLHGEKNITPDTPHPQAYGYDESAVFTGPGASIWENSSYADKQGNRTVEASYLTAAAVEHTINFISKERDNPFFVNLSIHETHTLVTATEEDLLTYPDTPEPQRTYFAAISRADRLIGNLLDTLKKLGLEKNTLVIFSSDNGPEDPHSDNNHVRYHSVGVTGGLRGQKRSLYLGGVNTHFIARWPGQIPAGKIDSSSIISGVDILPTFLAAANIKVPENYQGDGINIMPALKGEKFERSKPLFWEWRGPYNRESNWPELSMQDGDWILLMAQNPERVELYNVLKDRSQKNNLTKTYPERTNAMMEKLREWKMTLP